MLDIGTEVFITVQLGILKIQTLDFFPFNLPVKNVCGKNLDNTLKNRLASILNVPLWDSSGNYLGISTKWGRAKSQSLKCLMEKISTRLSGWKGKLLTQAGKGILIKAIIQAIPSYVMSILRLSKKFCKKISSSVANLWWSSKVGSRGIHWKDWRYICQPKKDGGMGFKDFNHMNFSLLIKLA